MSPPYIDKFGWGFLHQRRLLLPTLRIISVSKRDHRAACLVLCTIADTNPLKSLEIRHAKGFEYFLWTNHKFLVVKHGAPCLPSPVCDWKARSLAPSTCKKGPFPLLALSSFKPASRDHSPPRLLSTVYLSNWRGTLSLLVCRLPSSSTASVTNMTLVWGNCRTTRPPR